ncbi:hypothetical protein [Magnetospirillum sulfuroxidans]|uniref:Uncharacterized protein n=1 Tax=Magnetospirillum sulfuroxidans TaxID=611300 RepID=A0ABS5IGQ3_9PROT|nr:hypothetical protein [Magnetospirillum sulfuroxidans]MBR9972923.1 hypothetical protein [Magnetospirillum sulfuroxidans]
MQTILSHGDKGCGVVDTTRQPSGSARLAIFSRDRRTGRAPSTTPADFPQGEAKVAETEKSSHLSVPSISASHLEIKGQRLMTSRFS